MFWLRNKKIKFVEVVGSLSFNSINTQSEKNFRVLATLSAIGIFR